MRNWSTDTTRLKQNPPQHEVYVLEQLINFGLGDQKISATKLKKHWHQIKIDDSKRNYLQSILWPKS